MLSLNNISIEIHGKNIISNLSCDLDAGSICYIIGKNGSGKTSLLKAIAGIKSLKSGSISIFKHEIAELQKPYCLYIGHENALDPSLLVEDQLTFWAKSYNSFNLIAATIEYWRLREYLQLPCAYLSKGLSQKVSLSRLICSHADIWLLDESDANLDSNNLKLLHNAVISKANSGGIVLMSTHGKIEIESAKILDLNQNIPKLCDFHELRQ
ncbi:MAG: heme ABC exporter ATP-binding protein CcmA [Rickettsiaceae bacterium]|nr:heme ABC exporter ATP-binding protein CcmA [Rickettsiaceae bacterium]